jgi:hypothetical protein
MRLWPLLFLVLAFVHVATARVVPPFPVNDSSEDSLPMYVHAAPSHARRRATTHLCADLKFSDA